MTTSPPGGPSSSEAGGTRLATAGIAITGMHCQSCVALISETLDRQPGVGRVAVDLESAHAEVDYDSALIGLDDLCSAVAGVGYGASPAESSPRA